MTVKARPEKTKWIPETENYRTFDQIGNLVFNVEVNEDVAVGDHGGDIDQNEVLRYSMQPSILASFTEKSYHEQIVSLLSKKNSKVAKIVAIGNAEYSPNQIFTYVEEDGYEDEEERKKVITTSVREAESGVKHIFDDLWTNMKWILNQDRPHKIVKTCMSIMAFLRIESPGKPIQLIEKQLCKITCNTNGCITIKPALNTIHKFQINNRTFNYKITNTSENISPEAEENEWKIYSQIYLHRKQTKESLLGNFHPLPFPSSPSDIILNLSTEIISVTGFSNSVTKSNLYVEYLLDFHEPWKLFFPVVGSMKDKIAVTGSTNYCYLRDISGDMFEACFGCGREFGIVMSTLGADVISPRFFVVVKSKDTWDRQQIEGYGYVEVPLSSGKYEMTVPTWKPYFTPEDRARAYFIGGSPMLNDVKYIADREHSRVGLRTETGLQVQLRFDVVRQSGLEKVVREGEDSSVKLNAISDALARARAHIESIRSKQSKNN
ncbi:Pleiotropic negative transcriptional regulator [Nowakowskiella sp. JEL0407]|nr:Pleiotropic negative transcriptional regulator [Nowakowskiella sp. JEL0407]